MEATPLPDGDTRVEIMAPRKSREVVISGWSVPLIEATEVDGGEVWIVVDQRMACVVPAAQFENVAAFVADVIGVCFGYGAHPRGDERAEEFRRHFKNAPHPSLTPRRVHVISAVRSEATEPTDDPRMDGAG